MKFFRQWLRVCTLEGHIYHQMEYKNVPNLDILFGDHCLFVGIICMSTYYVSWNYMSSALFSLLVKYLFIKLLFSLNYLYICIHSSVVKCVNSPNFIYLCMVTAWKNVSSAAERGSLQELRETSIFVRK